MRILLIDDDESLVELLKHSLSQQNYVVDAVTTGEAGWQYGSTYPYDLVILDWILPGMNGISLCQRFRVNGYDVPILLLTARNSSQDKVKGLDAGADDYLGKPFEIEELTARIRALLRRGNSDPLPVLVWENIQLDPRNCEVTYSGQILSLTAKEYGLLELLLRHRHYVLGVEEIIDNLWSSEEYPAEATVRSHLRSLRQKLKQAGAPEDLIETVRGVGYRLKFLNPVNSQPSTPATPDQSERADTSKAKQTRDSAVIVATWGKYREKRHHQLGLLDQVVTAIRHGNPSLAELEQAWLAAHHLAENLGLFGFEQGSQLAQSLEHLLQNFPDSQNQPRCQLETEFETILTALHQELSEQLEAEPCLKRPTAVTAAILIVEEENPFTQSLQIAAHAVGFQVFLAPTLAMAKTLLYPEGSLAWRTTPLRPDLVLVKLSFSAAVESGSGYFSLSERLTLISELKLRSPTLPILVIADRDQFEERLTVTRRGGWFFLPEPIAPTEVIVAISRLLQMGQAGEKIMIVDADGEWLSQLPAMLQPWGFKLTTLGDSRQFWDVLCAINPQLLVLSIELPHISGIELCQVLRSHPRWQGLPILFLGDRADGVTQNRAFAVGADDFLSKPVIAQDLASRIRNRLERVRIFNDS
ncbi:MAG: response regulator [Microcoleaceae cyanobacterium]